MFRKSTQITDTEEGSMTLIEMEEDNMKKQVNSEKCNDIIAISTTDIPDSKTSMAYQRKVAVHATVNTEDLKNPNDKMNMNENTDNNRPNTSSACGEEKSPKKEVNSTKDDSKLHFYNHHAAQEYSPSQLGEDMLMAELEFGSS